MRTNKIKDKSSTIAVIIFSLLSLMVESPIDFWKQTHKKKENKLVVFNKDDIIKQTENGELFVLRRGV